MHSHRVFFFIPHHLILLRDLYFSRAATRIQLERLSPPGIRHETADRLAELCEQGLVRPRELRIGGEVVFCLSRSGFDCAASNGVIPEAVGIAPKRIWRRLEVSDMTILHELELVDLRIAFEREGRRALDVIDCQLETCLNQCSFTGREGRRMFPDGRLRLRRRGGGDSSLVFYIEHDRGSETLSRIVGKVADYRHLAEHGKEAFRLIVVVPSVERRNNIALELARAFPELPNFILIGVFAEVIRNPFEDVFLTPGQARKALEGFNEGRSNSGGAYRRSKARDERIALMARLRAITE